MKKEFLILLISLFLLVSLTGCFPLQCVEPKIIDQENNQCCDDLNYNHICDNTETNLTFPGIKPKEDFKTSFATIKTNFGDIKVELFDSKSPITVDNFKNLSRNGFYNNLTFHRISKDFVIQGGDPNGDGTGGPGYSISDEFHESLKFDQKYQLAMANSGPNTGGSQFFITLNAAPWLNGKHTIFGQVVEGTDIVDKISQVETVGEKPLERVEIKTIEIQN